ncbi:Ricin B lectin domain-containing protein OS=Streptomyces microflavus OX=1919 GN=Smic_78450 PE=4 SV=1 [Streptomyces microflavus]
MNIRRWVAAAAAVLSATVLTGPAQAAPAAAPVPSGPVVITNDAHTNYLVPDDTVGNAGTFLQVYYRQDHPFPRTFQFHPVNGRPGVFQWKSARTGNCADARTGEAGASVYLAACTTNKSQWWLLRSTDENPARWVLSPYLNEDLAVTGLYGDDNYAPLRELPHPDQQQRHRCGTSPSNSHTVLPGEERFC